MAKKKSTFVLITGASCGIGYEFAKLYARHGYSLVIVARNLPKLELLKRELETNFSVSIICFSLDLSSSQNILNLFRELKNRDLSIEILVNNAGVGNFGLFHKGEWQRIQEMIQVNIACLTQLSYLFIPEMLKSGKGKILNVASTAAFQPGPYMAVYYATKSYVLHFSEALSSELQGTGITVLALCPGPTDTDFQATAHMKSSKLFFLQSIPSAKKVAEFGFFALEHNKTVAVYGLFNKLFTLLVSFVPRSITRILMKNIQSSRF